MSLEFVLDLLQQRILSPGQVSQVLESLRPARNSLGRLALQQGLLTIRQVLEIYDLQSTNRKSFGAWALALGWLTDVDVDALMARQQLDRPAVRRALIELQLLNATEVAALERAFVRRMERNTEETAAIRPPKFHRTKPRRTVGQTPTR